MKKLFLLFFIVLLSCVSNDCGDIVDKYENNGKYFFTLVSNSGNSDDNNEGGGQAEVSKETYDSFNVGQEYCID